MAKRETSSLDPVEAFRRRSFGGEKRPAIPLREKLTVSALSALILVAPWMEGSVKVVPQVILCALSLLAFTTLFIPCDRGSPTAGENFKRLIKSPIFWLCLVFLGYILIACFNPYAEVRHHDKPRWWFSNTDWWLSPIKNISWLPGGVSAPFFRGGTWRGLIYWATPCLAVLSACVGLRHRRSLLFLFWVICINGMLIALVGILMKFTGTKLLLWSIKPATSYGMFSSFHYRNHGAAYLYPILALCGAMFFYYQLRARRRMQRSSPGLVFLAMGAIIAYGLVINSSRSGIVIGAVIIAVFVLLYIISLFASRSVLVFVSGLTLIVALAGVVGFTINRTADLDLLGKEFERMVANKDRFGRKSSLNMRLLMMHATYTLYKERPVYGWGAYSFPWVFRRIQLRPEYDKLYHIARNRNHTAIIVNAHCDWLQYLSNLGIVGMTLLLAMPLYWAGVALYFIRAISLEHIMIFLGCGLAFLQAGIEFNLQNPAILNVVTLMLVLAVLWMRMSPRWQSDDRSLPETS